MEVGNNSKEQLKSVVERIERINGDIDALTEDRGDIFKEAKGNGFELKALRTIIRMRAMDAGKRQEQEAILESYMIALGMI